MPMRFSRTAGIPSLEVTEVALRRGPVETYSESNRATAAVVLTMGSIAAGAGFALLTRAVASRDTAGVDRAVHPHAKVSKRHATRDVAEVIGRTGKWWLYVPAAYAVAAVLASRREDADEATAVSGAVVIAASATAAAIINELIDDLVPQPPAPPGRSSPDHPVYPSGHAFGTSALALSLAWILVRDRGVPANLVVPLSALLPVVSSGARLIEEKHWLSDIAGGLLGGIALAAVPLAIHEAGASLRAESADAELESTRDDHAAASNPGRPRSAAKLGRKASRNRVRSER